MDQIMWTILMVAACLLVIGVVMASVWAVVMTFLIRRMDRVRREMFEDFDKKHRGFPF